MAPTRQENASEIANVDQQSISVSVRGPRLSTIHGKLPEMCVRLTRRTMTPDLRLESRQAASHSVVAITGTEVTPSVEVTRVFPNTLSLHASIVPLATLLPSATTNSSLLHSKDSSNAQIPLIIIGVLVGVIIASLGMMILVAQFSWNFRGLKLYHRRSMWKEEHPLGQGMSLVKNGCGTTWATMAATRVKHVLDFNILKESKTTSNLSQNLRPVQQLFSRTSSTTFGKQSANNSSRQQMADWNRDDSREHLQTEEKDIAIALVAALRTLPSSWNVESDATNQSLASARNRAEVLPRSRSSQGSCASTPSQETTTTDFIECFSSESLSSRSSMTSSFSMMSGFDDEWSAYEVRRALTQSLEMKKGVLVAWHCPNAAIPDVPSATLAPLSLISRETCSSSATTDLDHISLAEGDHASLQCVPYLVVTCPSTSTIITLNSVDSSTSVNLGDFPLPPPLIHPMVAQKRSTVEQFIVMYER